MFYTVHGYNPKYKTLEEASKQAQRYCSNHPGEEYYIMQAYAVAEIPVTNVVITPITVATTA